MLRWILQGSGDFTWSVTDCEELVGVTWRLSDCEKLDGGYSQGMMGLDLGGFYLDGSEYGS